MTEVNEQFNKAVNYFKGTELWLNISKIAIEVIIILIISFIAIRVGRKIIKRVFTNRRNRKVAIRISERRENTLKKLLENTLVYSVYLIAFMTIYNR